MKLAATLVLVALAVAAADARRLSAAPSEWWWCLRAPTAQPQIEGSAARTTASQPSRPHLRPPYRPHPLPQARATF